MISFELNYLAVLIAGLIPMVIGSLWYSPLMFGKAWQVLAGVKAHTPEEMQRMKDKAKPAYAATLFGNLITAFLMANLFAWLGVGGVASGLELAFWLWLGFAATIGLTFSLFQQKPIKLFMIEYSYVLVNWLIMGGILAVWR